MVSAYFESSHVLVGGNDIWWVEKLTELKGETYYGNVPTPVGEQVANFQV